MEQHGSKELKGEPRTAVGSQKRDSNFCCLQYQAKAADSKWEMDAEEEGSFPTQSSQPLTHCHLRNQPMQQQQLHNGNVTGPSFSGPQRGGDHRTRSILQHHDPKTKLQLTPPSCRLHNRRARHARTVGQQAEWQVWTLWGNRGPQDQSGQTAWLWRTWSHPGWAEGIKKKASSWSVSLKVRRVGGRGGDDSSIWTWGLWRR